MIRNCINNNTISTYGELFLNNLETYERLNFKVAAILGSWMTTYLEKSCSFGLPRVPFVNCRQFMYLVISLLVWGAGCWIWLYQFLIIAYLFTFMNLFYATDWYFLLNEPFYAIDYLFYQWNLMIAALFPCIWCKFLQSVFVCLTFLHYWSGSYSVMACWYVQNHLKVAIIMF